MIENWILNVKNAIKLKSIQSLIQCFPFPALNHVTFIEEYNSMYSSYDMSSAVHIITDSFKDDDECGNFQKLCEAYVALNDHVTSFVGITDKFLSIAFGFNYSFNDYWLLPLAKHIYNTLVWLSFTVLVSPQILINPSLIKSYY